MEKALLSFALIIHLAFLSILLISPASSVSKKEYKRLLVKTITPSVRAQVHAHTSAPTPVKTPSQPLPQQKKIALQKEPPKPTPPTAPTPVKTPSQPLPEQKKIVAQKPLPPTPVKQAPPKNKALIADALLQELEESIAKIEMNSDKPTMSEAASKAKKSIAPMILQMDLVSAGEKEMDSSYADRLIQCLHQQLKLPEYGEVNIQLHLRQDGTVAKMVVLNTQSERNRRYLEGALPLMKFPLLEGVCTDKKESVFVLRFCNERI